MAFPSPGLWPLGFAAWAPLFVALHGVGRRRGGLLGLVAGWLFFALVLRWLAALTVVGWITLSFYMASYLALFGALSATLLGRDRTYARIAIPAAWVALEWVRSWLFTGFGWAALGQTLAAEPALIQAASTGGVWVLSLAVVSTNLALARAWLAVRRRDWRAAATPLVVAVAIPAGLAIYGLAVLAAANPQSSIRVAAIQGDIAPTEKWTKRGAYTALQRHADLTSQAVAAQLVGPDLVLWPETAIPVPVQDGRGLSARARGIRRFVREVWKVPLLFGVPERVPARWPGPDGTASRPKPDRVRFWNSAVLYHPDDRIAAPYRKRRLVPFGEYQPALFDFLPRVLSGPEFVPGDGGGPFRIAAAGAAVVDIGVLICFEDVFAEEAIARAGSANLLAVMTNDAWFSYSGRAQHVQIAVLRAVETGRSVVRAANTGISALIDAQGRMVAQAPEGPGFVLGDLSIDSHRTRFAAAPDVVPMLAMAGMLSALAAGLLVQRPSRLRSSSAMDIDPCKETRIPSPGACQRAEDSSSIMHCSSSGSARLLSIGMTSSAWATFLDTTRV
ncbi:MAG: apolipoprotein N-acyltransferase [Proteobacteria bacterium]|nr:apolipoprotein N-acyltransferase [Pseudomonadota bacterium]